MFVKVQFYKPRNNGYGGMAYTYRSDIDLAPGDKVICPTANDPEQRAMVVETNVPEPDPSQDWVKRIRSVLRKEDDHAGV